MNPYLTCPEFETDSFTLRLVRTSDAEDLLCCYSDPEAAARTNTDCCTTDFHFTELGQMQEYIGFWLREYENKSYIRFAIISKTEGKAAGTLEIFGGDLSPAENNNFAENNNLADINRLADINNLVDNSPIGVLRIDLTSAYWTDICFEELLKLVVLTMVPDYRIFNLKIKASNILDKSELLKKYGFVPSKTFRPEKEYFERVHHTYFCAEKGIAYCGLACCVCSENTGCAGCRQEGCKDKDWCKPYRCCRDKGFEGCWECNEFPCDAPMLNKPRIRTFAQLADEYGEEALVTALGKNEAAGLLYHYEGQLTGDYDLAEDKTLIAHMVFRDNEGPL